MKIKTSELTNAALDWAVAKCEGEIFESCPTVDPQIAKVWPLTGLARVENGRRVGYAIADARLRKTIKSYADEGGIRLWAPVWQPSTDWSQGGPIIERHITKLFRNVGCTYTAQIKQETPIKAEDRGTSLATHYTDWCNVAGPTPLIAAMRCFVASKLGEEVDVPEGLAS